MFIVLLVVTHTGRAIYNILRSSDRSKNRVLQPLLYPFDKNTRYIMHIYDTLQLTVYTGSKFTTNEWVLHAL